ncbi:MAG: hypothetical protein IPM23_10620 [Candidatus Melainabacteria bacterium]|nr:hypothetical protein [Candidatus Melainabacteria bacterium]
MFEKLRNYCIVGLEKIFEDEDSEERHNRIESARVTSSRLNALRRTIQKMEAYSVPDSED